MKTFRMFGMALLAIMLCVNLTSCSDDDDEGGMSSESREIIGEWSFVMTVTYYDKNGNPGTPVSERGTAVFRKDGTALLYGDEDYHWSLEDGIMTMQHYYPEEDREPGRLKVLTYTKIDSDSFMLYMEDFDEGSGKIVDSIKYVYTRK